MAALIRVRCTCIRELFLQDCDDRRKPSLASAEPTPWMLADDDGTVGVRPELARPR